MFERCFLGTQGHSWKLKIQMIHRDVKEYFLSIRVVTKWSNLNSKVVEAEPIHSFKNKYNRTRAAKGE